MSIGYRAEVLPIRRSRNALGVLFLGLIVALAPCCGAHPTVGADPAEMRAPGTPEERAIAARVSEERALRHVRELVALGARMGGTRSGARAVAYRAEVFRAAGLDVRLVEAGEKWCHEESAWKVDVVDTGGTGSVTRLASAWPYGFSPSRTGEGCLAIDGTSACESKPRVLLASKRAEARGSAERTDGAPAAVLVDDETTRDGSYPVVHHLREGDRNAWPAFGLSRADGAALRARARAGEHLHIRFELTAEILRARPVSVVATLPARIGAPPGYLLFCAHGDSDAGGPGADDNASGEATLFEIAGAWVAAIAAGEAPPPAREVRFAIWGSEIFSTRAYLAQDVSARGEILGVINYDQAGFGSGADQLNVEPDDLPANVGLVRTVAGVLAEFAGTPGFPARWATNKSLGGTDSYVFSDSALFRDERRPSLTLCTSAWGAPAEHPKTPGMPGESWSERDQVALDYDLYYHSAGDTPENTTDREPWNIGWCARVGALAAARWLEQASVPAERVR